MASPFNTPDAIQWYDGMLLAPQHFRQMAARAESLSHYHASLISPFHWGVQRFRYDVAALSAGFLVVRELWAVMPDGMVVTHSEAEGELKLDLRPHLDARTGKVTVHLAVVRDGQVAAMGGASAAGAADELARYSAVEGAPIFDEQTGPAGMVIPRLRPRLRLIAGVPASRYSAFPIFEASREGTTVAVSTDFIPSMIAVPAESLLGQLVERVVQRIRQKAVYLRDVIMAPTSTSEGSLREQNEQAITHLVAGLPALEAVLYTSTAHPFSLYTALCNIAGHVAAIATDANLVPDPFPRYNHDTLRETFAAVTDFILNTINDGISDAFHAIQFKYENGVFRGYFEAAWLQQPLVLGLRGQSGAPEAQVRGWMSGCVIGGETLQQRMRDNRILGAERRYIERKQGLVAKRGTILFEVKGDPRYLLPNETLELSNPVDPTGQSRPAEVFLFIGKSETPTAVAGASLPPSSPRAPRR
jgi:type VI secretion system protein ImpJ